jgi:hypothetical protein
MQKHFNAISMIFAVLACTACSSKTSVQQYENSSSVAEISFSSSSVREESKSSVPESVPSVTYVDGICGSKIPSTWHVRSQDNQTVWNREGNIEPPTVLTADAIIQRLVEWDTPLFKPALYSMADADTALRGHSEDPGAEDANRNEIDILQLSTVEFKNLTTLLNAPPAQYTWDKIVTPTHELSVLRNTDESGKYYGMELLFIPAEKNGRNSGLIIVNRSNDHEWNETFRDGFRHFLNTIDFKKCPSDW